MPEDAVVIVCVHVIVHREARGNENEAYDPRTDADVAMVDIQPANARW